MYDPAKEEYEPIWNISALIMLVRKETPGQADRTAIVYLLAGEYEINGHDTPQTGMKNPTEPIGTAFHL